MSLCWNWRIKISFCYFCGLEFWVEVFVTSSIYYSYLYLVAIHSFILKHKQFINILYSRHNHQKIHSFSYSGMSQQTSRMTKWKTWKSKFDKTSSLNDINTHTHIACVYFIKLNKLNSLNMWDTLAVRKRRQTHRHQLNLLNYIDKVSHMSAICAI